MIELKDLSFQRQNKITVRSAINLRIVNPLKICIKQVDDSIITFGI